MKMTIHIRKTYAYFCLFFIGSILPFVIVESYFQNYLTIGFLMIAAILFLSIGLSLEHLKGKLARRPDTRTQKQDSLHWIQKKEEMDAAASYYFRKNVW